MKAKRAVPTWSIIALLSAAFVLLLSETTSPLYSTPWGGDSAMFLTIGKYWARGVVPYVGLWDSKGPLIFAMDAAGYLLAGERWGVCLIQIALLYVSLTFAYKTFRLYEPSCKRCLGLVALYCVSLSFTYTDNGTEELIFPLISASVYLFARWARESSCQSGSACHPWRHAVVYGATFAAAFLSRLTNALGVFAGAMAIAVVLVVHREWRNLFENVGGFLAGTIVPILPFWLYFQAHGATGEWMYGSIFYNLGYAGSSQLGIGSLSDALRLFLGYGNAILLAVVGARKLLVTDRKAEGLLWLLVGLAPSFWLFRSHGFLHYGQVVTPYFVVIFSELWVAARMGGVEVGRPRGSLRAGKVLLAAYALLFVLLAGGMGCLSWAKSVYSQLFVREVEQYAAAEAKLVERIPEGERDSVLAYNTDTGFYLWFDIQPCYRFFLFQDWAIQSNETLRERLLEDYGTLAAKWILMEDTGAPTAIDGILDASYRAVAEEPRPNTCSVYRLYQLGTTRDVG